MTETLNAVIDSAEIFIEDHGILTISVTVNYGKQRQSFGGYDVRTNCAEWVENIFRVVGVYHWSKLKGKPVRITRDPERFISAIGNFIEDKWFEPKKDLKASKK